MPIACSRRTRPWASIMASFMPSPWPQTPCQLWPLFLRETEQRYIDVTVQLNVTHVITGSSKILAVHVLRCTKNCQACFLRGKEVSEHKFFTAFEVEFVNMSVFLFYLWDFNQRREHECGKSSYKLPQCSKAIHVRLYEIETFWFHFALKNAWLGILNSLPKRINEVFY